MTLTIDEVRFVNLAPTTVSQSSTAGVPRRKKQVKDDISLVPGEPLPKNGTCKHYGKSYRWFRFPCCGKLFPCDVCHETGNKDNHQMILANRMVCGFCSKEQAYSADKPCTCGKQLTRTKNASGAFWEGGKGTRDRKKMSKNDPRKYKGLNKTKSVKG